MACAAALTVQKVIEKENLLERVQSMGEVLERLLREEVEPLPLVGDIRGRGLFWAVEFMMNEPGRIPPPAEAKFCDRVVNRALDLGLNILGNLGVTGDVYVDLIILSPPYTVTEQELKDVVKLLVQAIQETTQEMRSWFDGSLRAPKKLAAVNGVNGQTNGHSDDHTQ